MRERAIDLGKIAAMSVLAAGIAFYSTHVKAGEAEPQVAAVELPKPGAAAPLMTAFAQRPVVTPAMKAAQLCGVQ